jgi:hypothetical protein
MSRFLAIILLNFVAGSLYSQELPKSNAWKVGSLGIEYGPAFRGTNPTGTEQVFTLAGEYSALGWSLGLVESIASDFDSSQTELFSTYSYPLGWVEVSGGLQGFLNFDTGHRDSLEVFLEARTEPIYGFNFFLGQYFELTHGFHSYSEFKVSHRFDSMLEKFGFEPYVLISFGNYHTDAFDFNHAQFGIDSVWQINDKFNMGIFAAAVLPMNGVKEFTQTSTTEGLLGIRLIINF